MSRQMDSGALTELDVILQLGGGGDQSAILDDGNVSQVLDVNHIIRRSLTAARTTGLFWFGFRTVHAGAGNEISTINPYTATGGTGSFPTEIPNGFDVWLLYASLQLTAGTAAFLLAGVLEINTTDEMRGKGTAIGTPVIAAGIWDSIETITTQGYGITAAGETLIRPNVRLRRGMTIRLRTESSGIATFDAVVVMGLFPSGLGQDVVT